MTAVQGSMRPFSGSPLAGEVDRRQAGAFRQAAKVIEAGQGEELPAVHTKAARQLLQDRRFALGHRARMGRDGAARQAGIGCGAAWRSGSVSIRLGIGAATHKIWQERPDERMPGHSKGLAG